MDSGPAPSAHLGMTALVETAYSRRLQNLFDPIVRIGRATILDVDQLLAHPHGDGAGGRAAAEQIAAHGTHLADRRDDRGRGARESLSQLVTCGGSAPLLGPIRTLPPTP